MGDESVFERAAGAIVSGGRLLRAWPLAGGVSAQVDALEIARPGGATLRAVLRRYGAADLAERPAVAAEEYALLGWLRGRGIPAPAPLLLDADGARCGSPAIAVGFVEGASDAAPPDRAAQLADLLARLHACGAPPELVFLPRQAELAAARLRRPPGDDPLARRIHAALAPRWPPPPCGDTLLHGDVWPGNLLWHQGRLAALIDWEDAALGDPLADLANARLELSVAWGAASADELLARYRERAAAEPGALALWELLAALRLAGGLGGWGLEPAEERRMRSALAAFAERPLAAIESAGRQPT